jgi:hypothetical protein
MAVSITIFIVMMSIYNSLLYYIKYSINYEIFICLGRQTKQNLIMVAKFQTLMLLIANAESSPLF